MRIGREKCVELLRQCKQRLEIFCFSPNRGLAVIVNFSPNLGLARLYDSYYQFLQLFMIVFNLHLKHLSAQTSSFLASDAKISAKGVMPLTDTRRSTAFDINGYGIGLLRCVLCRIIQ